MYHWQDGKGSGNRTGHYYYLKGQEGNKNGIEELNKICSIYGTGEGATGARCVNVNDINWITGYNPNNTGVKDPMQTIKSGTVYSQDRINEYGNNVKYTLLSTGVKYEPMNKAESETNTYYKSFTYYDEVSKTWKSLEENESVTFKSREYCYYPTTLTYPTGLTEPNKDMNATTGIASTSSEYKMLFTNSSTGAEPESSGDTLGFYYWLGSSYISTSGGAVDFGLFIVTDGEINCKQLCYTNYDGGGNRVPYNGIRPVVTLDKKVALKDSGTNKDGCKLYNMSL